MHLSSWLIPQIWRSSLATQTYGLVLNVTAPRNMNQGIGTPADPKGGSQPESRYRRSLDPCVLWGLRLCNHGRLLA
jgi:hypothetical protein